MDQHYSECEKHDCHWHTITNGEECPFCKLEMKTNNKIEWIHVKNKLIKTQSKCYTK
mgnify:CR=1 FL=1